MNKHHYKSICTATTFAAAKKLGYREKAHKILSSVFTIAAVTTANYGLCNSFMAQASTSEVLIETIKGSTIGLTFAQSARYLIAKSLYSRPNDERVSNEQGSAMVMSGQAAGYIMGNIISHTAL